MEIGNTLESAAKIVSGMGQEFTNTFEVLGNIKEGFQDILKHNLEDPLIQNLCYSVLCGGFMLLKCCYANLKQTIQEMEKEELPKRLHPYVREIRNYFESMEKKLQELDDIATEIWTTIRESKPRKYKLNAEEKFELKMLMRNFKRDLKTTEDKYKDADRALKSLQSELETYLTKEGVLAAGASALIGAGVGAACGVAKEILMGSQQLVDVAAKGAMLGAAVGALTAVYSINRKYEACVVEINSLQADLRILRSRIKENYPLLSDLKETMGDLNVV